MKILVIEDSEEIVDFIRMAFRVGWPDTELISTIYGRTGIEMVENEKPDILILDLGLPDIDGFQVLTEIRKFSNIPILILTVRADEANVVKGIELGADEYVIKPFRQLELLARIKALSRRQRTIIPGIYKIQGPFEFDVSMRKVIYKNKEIIISRTEGIILYYLAQNAGQIVSNNKLAELIWGDEHHSYSDTIRVYIRRIREKIESNPSKPETILTKPGLGYMMVSK